MAHTRKHSIDSLRSSGGFRYSAGVSPARAGAVEEPLKCSGNVIIGMIRTTADHAIPPKEALAARVLTKTSKLTIIARHARFVFFTYARKNTGNMTNSCWPATDNSTLSVRVFYW